MKDKSKKVLIITNGWDLHADAVISEIEAVGAECIRWHPGEMVLDQDVRFSSCGPLVKINSSGRQFSPEDILSVWYRRPKLTATAPSQDLQGLLLYQEAEAVVSSIYEQLNCFWCSPLYALAAARPKANQLLIAKKLGFSVPDFLISSRGDEIMEFVEKYGTVVLKPIHHKSGYISSGSDNRALKVQPTLIDASHLQCVQSSHDYHFPVFVRKRVPRVSEVRLIVIGSKVYAVEMATAGIPDIDSRENWLNVPHREIAASHQVEEASLALCRHFGLNFGAFDFVIDEQGTWWFLECNPNGQFLWLEEHAGIPLAKEMAELLLRVQGNS